MDVKISPKGQLFLFNIFKRQDQMGKVQNGNLVPIEHYKPKDLDEAMKYLALKKKLEKQVFENLSNHDGKQFEDIPSVDLKLNSLGEDVLKTVLLHYKSNGEGFDPKWVEGFLEIYTSVFEVEKGEYDLG